MRSYNFSLEKILNLRESREKEIIENMGKIQNELNKQEEVLKSLQRDIENINNSNFKNVMDLQYKSLCKSKIKEDIDLQKEVINSKVTELERVRKDLIEAQKDRKVMEKLKEKDKEKYFSKIRYEEQKELDEIAVLKFNSQGLN